MTTTAALYYHPPHQTWSKPVTSDPSLTAFLTANSEAEAWEALDVLLTGDLATIARDAVARHLRPSAWMANHADDVLAELRVKLTQKLWSLRLQVGEPIENIRAYTVTAAERACYAFLRRQFPERTRLRNRVRYALSHHPSTTLAEDVQGNWVCRSTDVRKAARPGGAQSMVEAPRAHALTHHIDPAAPLPDLAAALLATCDVPVEFNRFVEAMAVLLGVTDQTPVTDMPGSRSGNPLDRAVDPALPIDIVLEQRSSLRDVWQELLLLPVRQRLALLLNLRDGDGGATLQLLPATDVVSRSGIAAALNMPEIELAGLWHELPLDDRAIAERMGATRQQVINLRKSARARLARRLGKKLG